jgi:ABC-type transport system involved in multi-copper enzyme maturation permease subunit
VDDSALLWKELHVGGSEFVRKGLPVIQVFFVVLGGLAVIIFVLAILFSGGSGIREPLNDVIRAVSVGSLMTAIVGTVLQATASVGRERQRRTLDMLLTLPDGGEEVLRMKWLGSFMCGRWLLPALGVVLFLGMIGGVITPAALPLLALAAGIHVAFAASLGVYLSVAMPSTERAAFIAILVLFLAFTMPLAICPGGVGLLPPVAWLILLPPSLGQIGRLNALGLTSPILPLAVVLGLTGYACLAWVLWRLAVRRFRREGERAAAAA